VSTTNDKYGMPDLESSDQPFYMKHIVSSTMPLSVFPRLKADRCASLSDSMMMIDILIKKYEAQYYTATKDKNLLVLPNLFLKPLQGTKIKNLNTDEVYEIADVISNPVTGLWEGLIRINSITPPNRDLQEKLQFLTDDRLVRFSAEFTRSLGVENQTEDELLKDVGPIRPTIIYALIKKEPGSIGKTPFGPQKQAKPMHREFIRDQHWAGHSVEMLGQWFDLLVEFGCFTTDNRSADLLADWFERFMRQNTWVLKLNGVQELMYFQRLRDSAVTKWRQDLISRTVQYYFRLEEILPTVVRNIRKLDTTVNLATEIAESGKRWIAGREVTGPLTQEEYNALFYGPDGTRIFDTILVNDNNLT